MREEWKAVASISCSVAILAYMGVMLYNVGGGALLSAVFASALATTAISRTIASRRSPQNKAEPPEHNLE